MASTLRVLYVDDEPDLLVLSKLMLEADKTLVINTPPSAKRGPQK